MSDIALQMQRTEPGLATTAANVVFDDIIFSSGNIRYNAATGVITFNEAARYVIHWWVSTQAGALHAMAPFSISAARGGDILNNTFKTAGEVVGVAVITVRDAPVAVSLKNGSGHSVYYSGTAPVKAALLVLCDNPNRELAAYGSLYSDAIHAIAITAGKDAPVRLPEIMRLKNVTPGDNRLIIGIPGDYWIEFMVVMQSTSGDVGVDAGVRINGDYVDALLVSTVLTADFSTLTASSIVACAAGDVLDIALTGTSDASVLLGPRVSAVLSLMRLGE